MICLLHLEQSVVLQQLIADLDREGWGGGGGRLGRGAQWSAAQYGDLSRLFLGRGGGARLSPRSPQPYAEPLMRP